MPSAGGVTAHAVAGAWTAHVKPYANEVPGRIADALSTYANAVVGDATLSADDIAAGIDAKIETFRSSITRYAEPPWGAGNQGYGNALEANGVLLVWVLEDGVEHCEVCPAIAAGSPYERGAIPTWPKLGDTPCRDNCYCYVTADPDSWAAAFGGS